MSLSEVTPASPATAAPVAAPSSEVIVTTEAFTAANAESAGQIQSQIDQLEREEDTQPNVQLELDIQELQHAQQQQGQQAARQAQLRQAYHGAHDHSPRIEGTVPSVPPAVLPPAGPGVILNAQA